MNEDIKKPLSVVRMELMDDMANLINSYPIPMFIVEDVVEEVYMQVKKIAQQQYEDDKRRFEESQKNNDIDIETTSVAKKTP